MQPVMTDQEIRQALINDLESKAGTLRANASTERAWAERATIDAEDRAVHSRYAEHYERCAAHHQQAIELLKAAPMPPKDEPR